MNCTSGSTVISFSFLGGVTYIPTPGTLITVARVQGAQKIHPILFCTERSLPNFHFCEAIESELNPIKVETRSLRSTL